MSEAVRDLKGKIKIHEDRVNGSHKMALAYLKTRDYGKARRCLEDAEFHQAVALELKSVRP